MARTRRRGERGRVGARARALGVGLSLSLGIALGPTLGGCAIGRGQAADAAADAVRPEPAAAELASGAGPPDAALPLSKTHPAITAADFMARVEALTDPRTAGRATSSPGEALAADYVARTMQSIGLEPAGDAGSWRHRFEYTAGVALGPDNRLEVAGGTHAGLAEPTLTVDRDWRPLAFSRVGGFGPAPLVFAGYGLVASAEADRAAVDEYAGLDVEGRWVLILRDLPTGLPGAQRQALQRYASLRHKAMIARDRGAIGVLFVNGPRSAFREPLAPLRFDAALAGSGLAVLSLAPDVADRWLTDASGGLAAAQDRVDGSWPPAVAASDTSDTSDAARFAIPALRVAAHVDLETLRRTASNVVGRLQLGRTPSEQTVVLGAHLDHLGRGEGSSSLAAADEAGQVHPGADDNASGVAVLLEIAEALATRRDAGESLGTRDFVFAAWSGEELGLLGSDRWAAEHVDPHASATGPIAYLNFDMVGRLGDAVVIHGVGSSPVWTDLIAATSSDALPIALNQDAYLPTDSTSFYTRDLPILSAFTGIHPEYHTPRDRPALLNAEGAARIASLFERIAIAIGCSERPPEFVAQPLPAARTERGGLRVFLGTIPDYAETDVVGVRLAGVAPSGPAEAAGLRRGDTIVEVDDRKIENLYDYTYALEALRVGEPARITVLRAGHRLAVEVVPASRD
ncbi:MAG: M28 family peptidase [Myxococcota bacterium]